MDYNGMYKSAYGLRLKSSRHVHKHSAHDARESSSTAQQLGQNIFKMESEKREPMTTGFLHLTTGRLYRLGRNMA